MCMHLTFLCSCSLYLERLCIIHGCVLLFQHFHSPGSAVWETMFFILLACNSHKGMHMQVWVSALIFIISAKGCL